MECWVILNFEFAIGVEIEPSTVAANSLRQRKTATRTYIQESIAYLLATTASEDLPSEGQFVR